MAGHKQDGQASPPVCVPGNYYELRGEFCTWEISVETAVRIARLLERRWRPRWIKFVDLHGARAWVRGDSVFHLTESTEWQRFHQREFDFMLSRERQAEDERRYPPCDPEWDG